jgi:hypothetical protein
MFAIEKPATSLRTQLEVATERAAKVAKLVTKREKKAATQQRQADRREEWAKRLDPAAYTCSREGKVWIAEGPAGQTFHFRRLEGAPADVLCLSQSGAEYHLAHIAEMNTWECSCPTTPEQMGPCGCKHLSGWVAVRMAHAMAKAGEKAAA